MLLGIFDTEWSQGSIRGLGLLGFDIVNQYRINSNQCLQTFIDNKVAQKKWCDYILFLLLKE